MQAEIVNIFEYWTTIRVELKGVGLLVQYKIEDCVWNEADEIVALKDGAVPVHVTLEPRPPSRRPITLSPAQARALENFVQGDLLATFARRLDEE